MPILSHYYKVSLMEAFSEAIDWSNDFISTLDGESTRRHEVVLQVHNNECITIVHSDIFYEMQFTKLHEPDNPSLSLMDSSDQKVCVVKPSTLKPLLQN